MLVSFNGQFIPREEARVALNDTALLYGDSLFETLRAEHQRILLQKEHLDRLCLSAKLLDFPCERPRLEAALAQMGAVLQHEVSRLRLTLGRGPAQGFCLPGNQDGWFYLSAVAAQPPGAEEREAGAICVSAPNRRSNPLDHLPQMKRGNHTDCLYAADYARKKGAREALFVEDDLVIEGSSSNIFALRGEELFTPPLGRLVLAGVTRRELMSAAVEYGLRVTEQALSRDALCEADEVWLSNAMVELLPVATIDGRPLKRGSLWREIYHLYKQRTET